MNKRLILIVLLGALPATAWSILSLNVGWQTHWTVIAWAGTLSLWATALLPGNFRLHPVIRMALAIGLALSILLAVFPIGFNLLFLVEYGLSLSLAESLRVLGTIVALLAPTATAAFCLVSLIRPNKPAS